MKKLKNILIVSVCAALVLLISVAISLWLKEPMQIISRKSGIALPKTAEIIEFTDDGYGGIEATIKIEMEDRSDLVEQLLAHSYEYIKDEETKLFYIEIANFDEDIRDYSLFENGKGAPWGAKYMIYTNFFVAPDSDSDYCMVYFFRMG